MSHGPLPDIPPEQMTPLVEQLLRIIQGLIEENRQLREEIDKLKKQKGRPKIKPSALEKPKRARDGLAKSRQANPTGRCEPLKETRVVEPENIPEGSRFKGYKEYTIQDLVVQATEITFRLKVYVTPDGQVIRGELPKEYSSGHFGPDLIAHCLQLYHGGFMTQPALLEHLGELGVKVSAGQLHTILSEDKEAFHLEKDAVRQAGIEESPFLNVDDTGARHEGKNGTCLCSPFFCSFETTKSKSRLNFLEILRGSYKDYLLDEGTLLYAFERKASDSALSKLDEFLNAYGERRFRSSKTWMRLLKKLGVTGKKDIRVLTEGAVLSSAVHHGLPEGIPIMSDAAGQFHIWVTHALCWIHEERHYRKLVPVSDAESEQLAAIRGQIWNFYEALKTFSNCPSTEMRTKLNHDFDKVFQRTDLSPALNELLRQTYSRRQGLLQILDNPQVPLHNNDCERDIRQYVKRRMISSTTRSESGRKARDTFLSLKKTCQKLEVSFLGYLKDRVHRLNEIPSLATTLRQQAQLAQAKCS